MREKMTIKVNVQEEKEIDILDLITDVEDTLFDVIQNYVQLISETNSKIEIEENDEFNLYKRVVIGMYHNLIKFYGNNIVNENNIENEDDE